MYNCVSAVCCAYNTRGGGGGGGNQFVQDRSML
jgi:hypothetical protein